MKKFFAALAVLCAFAAAVFAQSDPDAKKVTVTPVAMLPIKSYGNQFLNGGGLLARKYLSAVTENDYNKIAVLGGNDTSVDTPFEIAALSLAAGVIDIRPVEADAILPKSNLKLSYTKLGAAAYQDLLLARFLGNTAAVGIHEGELKFALDKGGITRAEVESFYRQNIGTYISEIVDSKIQYSRYGSPKANILAEIKQNITNFCLNPSPENFNVLARNQRAYPLSDGNYGNAASTVLRSSLAEISNALSDTVDTTAVAAR